MARLSSANAPDLTAINLTRLLARLKQTLITPDSATESRLRTSLERDKIEILGDFEFRDDSSEGEDLLGEDTPSEATDSHASIIDPQSTRPSPTDPTPPLFPEIASPQSPTVKIDPEPSPEPHSTLRARHIDVRAELFNPASTSTGISTASNEALLTHQRLEQEKLTSSMLDMATALKDSSLVFQVALEEEKSVLDSATKGLDKNELGLEAAQRKMGYLRTMTEGKGWWGRMMMYAWIAGLMVVAILIVFVFPKLRF
ncbi:hypothetical protein BUE80_DR013549 [Diplocarpon rosae]|nr:hypothetical protein BUE80_DR013549 [Diplocarpon rosae]